MKKKLFFYLFAGLLTAGSMVFTSCSDDDDDMSVPIDEELDGEYKGILDIVMLETSLAEDVPKNITVEKSGDNAINLVLSDFSLELNGALVELGDIRIENCVLSQRSNGGYSFAGQQTLSLSVGDCDVVVTGSIVNSAISVSLTITWNSIPIYVTFEGTKLTGTESSEAVLLSFWFDPAEEANAIVTNQSEEVAEGQTTVTFSVIEEATNEQIEALVPTVTVSEGATYTIGTESYINGKTVTVVAENGATAVYTVQVTGRTSSWIYTFEEWENMGGVYDEPSEEGLASSNGGAALLNAFGYDGFPVLKDEGYESNYSAKLVTLNTISMHDVISYIPAIVPGSVFTGTFETVITNQLESTKFGIAYDKKPVTLKGVYKYTAGTNFIDGSDSSNIQQNTGDIDQGSIIGVLYEATDEDGEEVTLTGVDINSSEYRVAVATLYCSDQAEWTEFSLSFEMLDGKTYDSSKSYKLAIVCSSSKDGADFKGAENSTLWVDNLEVIGETVITE